MSELMKTKQANEIWVKSLIEKYITEKFCNFNNKLY